LDSIKSRWQRDGRGQAKRFQNGTVSKRIGSLALFRHVTAKNPFNQKLSLILIMAMQITLCSGAVPPSPREKAFLYHAHAIAITCILFHRSQLNCRIIFSVNTLPHP
jgi:hypothetical protein